MTDAQTALAAVTTALQDVAAAVAEKDASLSKLSLQNDSLTAANVQLQAQLDTANATIASLKAAADPWSAVDKTGATDVTDKVQALIDKGLAVPAGVFLIDAVKGLKVTGALKMDPNTVLQAKATDADHYCIVDVAAGASVDGGKIIGDRDNHIYGASTEEWGYGLRLRDRAKASNVQISKCTGDGYVVVGDNVEVRNIVSVGNRRQGCSVFACTGFRAYDCVSSDTSGAPNGPCAGWDFEPDAGSITDARLERCVSRNNRAGFLGWVRAKVAGNVDVTLVDCITDGNANGFHAEGLNGKVTLTVQGGKHTNTSANVRAETGSTIAATGCTFALTGKTRTPFTLTGTDTRTKYDIQTPTSTSTGLKGKAVVGTNSYV